MDINSDIKAIPLWANWLSVNEDGVWYFSKYEPLFPDDGYWVITGKKEIAICEAVTSEHKMAKYIIENGVFRAVL